MKIFIRLALTSLLLITACNGSSNTANDVSPKQAAALKTEQNAVILDVREDSEWKEKHIPGAIHIPLSELPKRLAELEPYKNAPLITQCQRGGRSVKAYETLKSAGFNKAYNMTGGLEAWDKEGLPTE